MNLLQRTGQQRRRLILALLIILSLTAAYLYHAFHSREPAEIALVIGEPYETMRQRSSADIAPHLPGHAWYNTPKTDARLRFIDSEYGFVTPPARFFTVIFDDGIISGVRMSPQIEPLPYDGAIKIVLDLQNQWRKAGWKPIQGYQPLTNTSESRDRLHRMKGGAGTTYWKAGDKYQITLNLGRFKDDKYPDEERYLITLAISKPW
jgi:hypothetical protein